MAAAILPLLSATLHATVLTGPITNSNNGNAYYLLAPATIATAEAEAISLGGHIVTINDSLENAWVLGTFGLFGGVPRSLWLGLNDVAVEGQFVWMDGNLSAYRNWAPGEPNNGDGFYPYENHVMMIEPLSADAGKWNDVIDSQSYAAVVEIAPAPTNNIILAGPITNTANDHVYYLLNITTRATAGQLAASLGGYLAYINDASENGWILANIANFGGQLYSPWIGLNDIQEEGNFVWGSNQPAFYQNWAPGEPNNGGGFYPNENYAVMIGGAGGNAGMWNDVDDAFLAAVAVEIGDNPPPQKVAAAIRFSQVEISWNSSAQFGYQVQYTTNLATGGWFNLGGAHTGTGSPMSVTDSIPLGEAGRFYRVLSSQ